MAQLDRFLSVLVSSNGTSLILSEGDAAAVMIKDSPRPVMKQPLTSAQILTLVREIAPASTSTVPDAHGTIRFDYTSADGAFEVSMSQNGKTSARVERKSAVAAPPSVAGTPSP